MRIFITCQEGDYNPLLKKEIYYPLEIGNLGERK